MKKNMKVKIWRASATSESPPKATATAQKFYKWHKYTSFKFLQLQCFIFLPDFHLTLYLTWFMCLAMHFYAEPENILMQTAQHLAALPYMNLPASLSALVRSSQTYDFTDLLTRIRNVTLKNTVEVLVFRFLPKFLFFFLSPLHHSTECETQRALFYMHHLPLGSHPAACRYVSWFSARFHKGWQTSKHFFYLPRTSLNSLWLCPRLLVHDNERYLGMSLWQWSSPKPVDSSSPLAPLHS